MKNIRNPSQQTQNNKFNNKLWNNCKKFTEDLYYTKDFVNSEYFLTKNGLLDKYFKDAFKLIRNFKRYTENVLAA